jgi:hypothetical protein
MHAILQTNRQNVPLWLAEMQRGLANVAERIGQEASKWTHRLETLSEQVEQALRRVEARGPAVPDGTGSHSPWAVEILAYLDRRRASGAKGDCPLPELFGSLHEKHAELSVPAFHDTLRRLQDRRALRLVPFNGSPQEITEPEYALVDGTNVLYFVSR